LKTWGRDDLMLTKISLQAEGGAPIEFENEDQSKISCPDNCMVAFCKGSFPPPPPPPEAPENDGGTIDDEDSSGPAEPDSPFPDMHLYNCAKLSAEEKDEMKRLSCKTTAI